MLNVREVDVDELKPWEDNPRDNDAAVDAVARSISSFGFNAPILCDSNLTIVAGHTRWKAARKMGLARVPVIVLSLSDAQRRAFAIADNKTAEIAEWNSDRLFKEILALGGEFDMTEFGFSTEEMNQLTRAAALPASPDDMPDPVEEPVTRSGDLWLLGDHRLLCGTSLDGDEVARATGGQIALAVTDPPFELDAYEQARALRLAGVKTGVVLGGGREIFKLANIEDYRLRFDFVVIYDRSVFMTGKSALMYRHNRVMLLDCDEGDHTAPGGFSSGVVAGRGVAFDRDKWASVTGTKCSVLQAPVQKSIYGYGKACDIFRAFVRAMDSERIYDPFAGSGTGMIACEIEGKAWTGIEIRPDVCDLAVRRWEAFTGRKAARERR